VADGLLSTDLESVSGPGSAIGVAREPTPDARNRNQRAGKRRPGAKHSVPKAPEQEPPSELDSPEHEIDSFA